MGCPIDMWLDGAASGIGSLSIARPVVRGALCCRRPDFRRAGLACNVSISVDGSFGGAPAGGPFRNPRQRARNILFHRQHPKDLRAKNISLEGASTSAAVCSDFCIADSVSTPARNSIHVSGRRLCSSQHISGIPRNRISGVHNIISDIILYVLGRKMVPQIEYCRSLATDIFRRMRTSGWNYLPNSLYFRTHLQPQHG